MAKAVVTVHGRRRTSYDARPLWEQTRPSFFHLTHRATHSDSSRVLVLTAELPSDEPPVAGALQLRGSFPGICPAGRCPRIAITNSRSGCGAPGSGRETSARFLRGAHAWASSPAVADVATERHSDAASEPASEQPVPRDSLANGPALPCLIA
eukprot:scaffold127828_cov24-Phaeocystis_antarctica.AAC.1